MTQLRSLKVKVTVQADGAYTYPFEIFPLNVGQMLISVR